MASIARGLESGINLGFKIDEALRRKQMRDAFKAAQEDKAFAKHSPEQGAQMRAESEMVDEYGRPIYEFSIEPGSTTYTRRKITYPEAPITTEGMSFGGPMYGDSGGLTPTPSRTEIARMYSVPTGTAGTDYAFTPDTTGEGIYAPEQPPVERGGLGRALSVRDTGISRPIDAMGAEGPERTAAYKALTRQLGEPTTMAPELTEYLGQTVKGGLSKEAQQAMLYNRIADIISAEDPIEGMKFKIMATQEARAAQSFDVQQKLANLQLKAAERGEKFSAAEEKLVEEIKSKPELLSGDLNQLFTSRGIPLERAAKLVESFNGLETGSINRSINIVKKAFVAAKGNLDNLLVKSLEDKDFDPTSHMVKRRGPNGGVVIDIVETLPDGRAGRVMSSLPEVANDAEAMDTIYNALTNFGNVTGTLLKNQKIRQEISTGAAYEKALGRRWTGAGAGGRDYTAADNARMISSLNGTLKENRSRAADLQTQLGELRGRKDPESVNARNAINEELDILNEEADGIRAEIKSYRSGAGAGGGLGKQPTRMYQAGDVETYVDPKTGKEVRVRFKGGENKQENWEVVTGESAAPAPAKEGGLSKPSKGMTDKQYEDWIDEKLIGAFTSRVAQLQSIIKDNPNPKIREAAQRMLEKEKTRPAGGGVDMPL